MDLSWNKKTPLNGVSLLVQVLFSALTARCLKAFYKKRLSCSGVSR